MSEVRQTFHKNERLCRTKLISEIFENGSAFYTSLFKVVWNISDEKLSSAAQIAVSVPKRNFKLAVSRNLIKRRIREAYRKNKKVLYELLEKENLQIVFMVIYRRQNISDYKTTEKSVIELIEILCRNIDQASEKC